MTLYLTSDLHINHGEHVDGERTGILKFTDRPWADTNEMNAAIRDNWNAVVRQNDDIWVLGDFAFSTSTFDLEGYFASLNGHKHLVIGNHDEKNKKVLALPWESQSSLHTLRHNGLRAEMCHYPLASWKNMSGKFVDGKRQMGALMFHGHSHGNLRDQMSHRFDVGIDAVGKDFDYGPIPVDALVAIAETQEFQSADHHD